MSIVDFIVSDQDRTITFNGCQSEDHTPIIATGAGGGCVSTCARLEKVHVYRLGGLGLLGKLEFEFEASSGI